MPLKTGTELRHSNKLRVERFKKKMKEQGYKNVTVFMNAELLAELERLKEAEGLNRQNALEHIFEVYQKTITSNETSNTKAISPPPENVTEYRLWLIEQIESYKQENLTNAQIAEQLNNQGHQTTKGNQWTHNAVKALWNRRKDYL